MFHKIEPGCKVLVVGGSAEYAGNSGEAVEALHDGQPVKVAGKPRIASSGLWVVAMESGKVIGIHERYLMRIDGYGGMVTHNETMEGGV